MKIVFAQFHGRSQRGAEWLGPQCGVEKNSQPFQLCNRDKYMEDLCLVIM